MNKILTLNLKREYFEAIKSGVKKEEYREIKEYWTKRLNKEFTEIHIKLGYPKATEEDKILKFKWNGFKIKEITHKQFGNNKIKVYAIDLREVK
jgi:Zn/Cd-binding protein ZinT